MSLGYVYILSNPSMPGILKIGKTTRSVDARALELFSTGVPEPFKIEHSVWSPDCDCLENTIHKCFSGQRVSAGREFFKTPASDAIWTLDDALKEQVSCLVSEFLPDYDLSLSWLTIGEADILMLASEADVSGVDIAAAFHLLTPEEYTPALERLRSHKASRLKVVGNV